MSKPKYVRAARPVPDVYVPLDGPVISSARPSGDASFITGLLLGTLTGAALVTLTSSAGRRQVQTLAQQLGLNPAEPGAAGNAAPSGAQPTRVPPPPDPLSSESSPPTSG